MDFNTAVMRRIQELKQDIGFMFKVDQEIRETKNIREYLKSVEELSRRESKQRQPIILTVKQLRDYILRINQDRR